MRFSFSYDYGIVVYATRLILDKMVTNGKELAILGLKGDVSNLKFAVSTSTYKIESLAPELLLGKREVFHLSNAEKVDSF